MKETLQIIWSLINTKIGVAVISVIVTTGFNVLYRKWQVRKDQLVRFENVIGDRIAESLLAVRDIELKLRSQELLCPENSFKEKEFDMFGQDAIYPTIMHNKEEFAKFIGLVNNARRKYEPYLDYESAAYLYYGERYLLNLAKYVTNQPLLTYPLAGAIFFVDLQKWQIRYDQLLIRKVNHQKCKLYAKSGWKWELEKKKVMKKLWEKSVLFKLMKGIEDTSTIFVKEILMSLNNQQ